jgi:hypothetical protein
MTAVNFVNKYGDKFGMNTWTTQTEKTPLEVLQKMNKKQSKVTLYYFQTDVKFMLKARLWQIE